MGRAVVASIALAACGADRLTAPTGVPFALRAIRTGSTSATRIWLAVPASIGSVGDSTRYVSGTFVFGLGMTWRQSQVLVPIRAGVAGAPDTVVTSGNYAIQAGGAPGVYTLNLCPGCPVPAATASISIYSPPTLHGDSLELWWTLYVARGGLASLTAKR